MANNARMGKTFNYMQRYSILFFSHKIIICSSLTMFAFFFLQFLQLRIL